MKMPRFTAEASIYKLRKFYQPAATHFGDSFGKSAVVQPELRKTDYECVHDCLEAGGGDGGGGEVCRPECGPCYNDPDSPTGRSRTCVTANCETYDRQCPGRRIPVSPRSALAR